ncbi:hypothetical protein ACH5RR_014720 [Cinchona calisaya]|uniref:CCHC-type domain-containing protein n=1 Tax=Cinchona calisaya TaxID=153742 RepID=A0ABD2ZR23_9GENT
MRGTKVKCNGTLRWVNFKYGRCPDFCYNCGIIGHSEKGCYSYGNNNQYAKDNQFGPWLRVGANKQMHDNKEEKKQGYDEGKREATSSEILNKEPNREAEQSPVCEGIIEERVRSAIGTTGSTGETEEERQVNQDTGLMIIEAIGEEFKGLHEEGLKNPKSMNPMLPMRTKNNNDVATQYENRMLIDVVPTKEADVLGRKNGRKVKVVNMNGEKRKMMQQDRDMKLDEEDGNTYKKMKEDVLSNIGVVMTEAERDSPKWPSKAQ